MGKETTGSKTDHLIGSKSRKTEEPALEVERSRGQKSEKDRERSDSKVMRGEWLEKKQVVGSNIAGRSHGQ